MDEYFLLFNQARKGEKHAPDTCNQAFLGFLLGGLAEVVERLHRRASGLIGRSLIGASPAQRLSPKKINPRQFEILEHLASLPGGIALAELKRQTWYRALYRHYSRAKESRDWKDILARGLAKKSAGGVVTLAGGVEA